jgi:purine-binding chemotaxis protein CheW
MSSERESAGMAGQAESLLAFADALLAREHEEQARGPTEIRQYVTFYLRDGEYGIPILQCREIVRISSITRVPEAPPHVRGVVNLRGHIIPAVDTRKCLGLEPASPTPRSRLIVVEAAGRLFALIVDRVVRILKLATSDIEPPSEEVALLGVTGVARAGDAVIRLLDVEQVLHVGPAVVGANTKGEDA